MGSSLWIGGCSAASHIADGGTPDAEVFVDSGRDGGVIHRDGGGGDAGVDVDSAVALSLPCGRGALPFAGPLPCVGAPCGVITNEQVDGPHFRNDRPSIAVDSEGHPEILFSIADGGYTGVLARRLSGAWTTSTTPMPVADGTLVFGSDGCGYAFTNDGAFGSGLYQVSGTRFEPLGGPAAHMIAGGRLVLDAMGALHTIGYEERSDSGFVASMVGSTWTERSFAPTFSFPGSVAVGPNGAEHHAWLDPRRSELVFYEHGGVVEPLFAAGTYTSGGGALWGPAVELAVGGAAGDGDPRLLFADYDGTAWVARRESDGPWSMTALATAESSGSCTDPAPMTGTCQSHRVTFTPLGLVGAASGDAVGLMTRNQVDSAFMASCSGPGPGDPPGPPGPPRGGCSWSLSTETRSDALWVVRVDAAGASTTTLLAGVGAVDGTVALGPDGHLHAAIYAPTMDYPEVRYLEVAATR